MAQRRKNDTEQGAEPWIMAMKRTWNSAKYVGICNSCQAEFLDTSFIDWNYCPKCGAPKKGVTNED